MTVKKAHKKPAPKQAPLFGNKPEEHLEPANLGENLSPIIDKKSYDRFIKIISLRVYAEFEKTLKDAGLEKPELSLVGFDLKKTATDSDKRMSDYIALNARVIIEKAFPDRRDFAEKYMPRVVREMAVDGSVDPVGHMESKVQHDLMMEIRSIAMTHIPESDRYGYRHKLKVL
jgi:hypothetical protein